MKTLFLSLLLLISVSCLSQVRVEPKEKTYLYLSSAIYEVIKSDRPGEVSDTYYSRILRYGYEYPTIQQDYFQVSIFERIDGLVQFYTELANLENKEDGTYQLSIRVRKDGQLYAVKKGSRIKLTSKVYKYEKYKINEIKTDLELLKSMLNQ
jgi:hypothetical protein